MASNAFKQVGSHELRKMELGEVLGHIKKAVAFLKEAEDYSTKDVGRAINVLDKALDRKVDNIRISKEARDHGLAEQFVKIVQSLEHHFTSSDKSEQGADNLVALLLLFGNYTNQCPALGIDLAKHGGIEYIISLLTQFYKPDGDVWLKRQVTCLLRCLHNSIRHDKCSVNRPIYRKAGVVGFMEKLLGTNRRTRALLILSFIVDEDESEILRKDNKAVAYLVGMFKKAAKSNDHSVTVHLGDERTSIFDLVEIANGLNHLIINDANKKVVFQTGAIPVMNSMLACGFSAKEQTLAAKLLWRLSFDEEIQKSDAIKESLTALTSLKSSKTKSVRSACENAVWQISSRYSGEKKKPEAAAATSKDSGHIMISYNWTHKERALQIRNELKEAGYNVWIDVDKMEDDILDSMADAVTKSSVVLLCMTPQYHASQSCRSEATYAYKKKKPVIPLLLEDNYDPEGWLDVLISTKLYYKLSSDMEMKTNIGELTKAIGRQSQQLGVHDDSPDSSEPVSTKFKSTASASSPTSDACSWSNERVRQWFDDIKLPQLKEELEFCDGNVLNDMYEKSSNDSKSFETDCKSNFGLEFRDILRLKWALRKLF